MSILKLSQDIKIDIRTEKNNNLLREMVLRSIDICHAENCFNIMEYYYNRKDNKNFKVWYDELKKWPNTNEQITKYTEIMENQLQ